MTNAVSNWKRKKFSIYKDILYKNGDGVGVTQYSFLNLKKFSYIKKMLKKIWRIIGVDEVSMKITKCKI